MAPPNYSDQDHPKALRVLARAGELVPGAAHGA